jgi:hypothetical protein
MMRFSIGLVRWRQRWRERVALLTLLVVCMTGVVTTRDDILAGLRELLCSQRPLSSTAHFHKTIRDADTIVVRDGGFRRSGGEQNDRILFTVTNRTELLAVYDGIEFVRLTNAIAGVCLCHGWPGMDWYRDGKLVALTSVQHARAIRWREFGTSYVGPFRGYGDILLTTDSAIWLIKWLRSHGITDHHHHREYSQQQIEKLEKIANKMPGT